MLFKIGQILTTLGVFLDSKIVVYVGRILFGLGGENLAVVCSTYASAWFRGQALNMAVGFVSSSTIDDIDCEKEENKALGYVLAIASTTVILSLFGAIISGIMDKVRAKYSESDLEEQPKVIYKQSSKKWFIFDIK